jgi:PAS domain S-box-containing protein
MADHESKTHLLAPAHHAADSFRLLVEAVVDYAIFMLDPEGRVASWNPGAERLYGYQADEIIGKHFSCFYLPDAVAAGEPARHIQKVLASGRCEHESKRVRKDGSTFWVVAVLTPLKDPQGKLIGFAKVIRDLTEHKLADDRLRRERDLSDSILKSLPGIFYMYDETGQFLRWNEQFEKVSGYTTAEMISRHPLDFFDPKDRKLLTERIISVFQNGMDEVEADFVARDGRVTPYFFNGVRFDIEGRPCLLGMGIDITARRRAERENARLLEDLNERVKEMTCLHKAMRVLHEWHRTPADWLGEIVRMIPPAWRHPERTSARAAWGELEHVGPGFERTPWMLKAEFTDATGCRGTLEVAYREPAHETARDPFLPEECALLDSLAEMLRAALDRRQAEVARREWEARFRGAFDFAAIGMALVAPDGRFLHVNRSMCDIVGYSKEELERIDFQSITYPDDLAADLEKVTSLLEGSIPSYQMEKRYIHKHGRVVWVLLSVSLVRDEQGGPRYFISQVQDITERKRAEEALVESRTRLQREKQFIDTLMGSLPGVVYLVNAEGRLLQWNRMLEQVTGAGEEEIAQRRVFDLMPEEQRQSQREALNAILARGRHSLEADLVSAEGKRVPYYFNGVVLHTETGPLALVIGIDLSERKRLEAQFLHAQKMEAIGHLAGGIAHDFNNLLTVIFGFGEMLLKRLPPDSPEREAAAMIYQASESAAALTRQLLAFGRKSVLQPELVDLNAIVLETEKLLRRVIGEDVALATVLDSKTGRVKADPGQVGQILLNLAVNARDAMSGGGRLTIQTQSVEIDDDYCVVHPYAKPGRYVVLIITDTGCGMSPEVRSHIFEPFFTTKEAGKGSGLGLSTVYGIIKQSGGHIEVYSELGHGTTFRLYFPAAPDSVIAAAVPPCALPVRHGSERVLLVEDEGSVRRLALLALQSHGYEVLTAGDGKEALVLAERLKCSIDILVTDVVMPEMSGRELAETLRPLYPNMRILYVSGYTDDAVVRHGMLNADVAFLQKPYSPLTLAKKVREVLDAPRPEEMRCQPSSARV